MVENSLKNLIIQSVKHYCWLDYQFDKLADKLRALKLGNEEIKNEYVKYLESLSNEDLLETYRRVMQNSDDLC